MKVQLVTIGSEVLSGFTLNLNVAYIGKTLAKRGIHVSGHMTCKDLSEDIENAITYALENGDVVIATGGLGPTIDDMTRQVASKITHSEYTLHKPTYDLLLKKYGDKYKDIIKVQSTLPSKAEVLINPIGSAPGLLFNLNGKYLILLPGVPYEMEAIFENALLPLFDRWNLSEENISLWLHYQGVIESKIDPILHALKKDFPFIHYGIYPALGTVSVNLCCRKTDNAKARNALEKCKEKLTAHFPDCVFESKTGKVEEAVAGIFTQNHKTLSLAESCTGGKIASSLTLLSGASNYFLGSFVAYSNQVKRDALGVKDKTLESFGAVSSEVVKEMAEGVMKSTKSDFSAAVSGIAGPLGGTEEKPVGTVYVAVGAKNHPTVTKKLFARGTRLMVIDYTVNVVLGMLYQTVKRTLEQEES